MDLQARQQMEQCVAELKEGTLTEERLLQAFAATAPAGALRQDLLYLQSVSVGIDSQVLGMRLLIDGEFDDGPDDPEDWPYKSVLEAIRDGWRVISFPNLALLHQPPYPPLRQYRRHHQGHRRGRHGPADRTHPVAPPFQNQNLGPHTPPAQCWRQSAPVRDWIIEEDFDPGTVWRPHRWGCDDAHAPSICGPDGDVEVEDAASGQPR